MRYLWLLLIACDGPIVVDGGADAGRHVPMAFEPTEATRAYCAGDDDAIEARITELLGELTLEEKIEMMHGASVALSEGTWLVRGVERLDIPGLHMLDGPRGLSRFSQKRGTAFPVAMLRGATWDPELERRVGAAMARELRSAGADTILAPTINILRHPRWGRAQETYGEDVFHMGSMGVAFILGAQSEGVIASAKHYAVNSIEDTRHEVDVIVDERTLREIYLPHFRRAVVEGRVGSVMSAYNQVNGLYCDLNRHLLTEILKDEWGFSGFVESDWLLGTHGDGESVRAGLDIEMPASLEFRGLSRAVTTGEITEHDVDASVRRILRAQLCFGLDERERTIDDPSARETVEHLALAREVAARGIVLLRNEGSLPLAPSARIVLLGRAADVENIGDEGSSAVLPTEVVTALEGLSARATVTHLTAIDDAIVSGADAVIVVTGLLAEDEGESDIAAGDRETLALLPSEVELIRAAAALNGNVVVVLEGGAAITVSDWVGDVEALLFAFYPGVQGGHAIADVIFGDVNPSGRLPFSIPVREDDLPAFDNVSTTVTYGYFHGYRHLAENGTAAAFPFGFGLSYTTFAYANLVVTYDGALTAAVDVTNTGTVRGIETVQLYVSAIGSSVERADSDLRAFAQVELDPGETQTVTLTVSNEDLMFWGESGWELEAIDYEALIATSAEDVALRAPFAIE